MDQEFVTEFQLIKSEMVAHIPALDSLFEEFDLDCGFEEEDYTPQEEVEVFYEPFIFGVCDDQIDAFRSALQALNLSYELIIGTSDQEGVSYELERKLPHQAPQIFKCTNRGQIFFTLDELLQMENPQAKLATIPSNFLEAYLAAQTQPSRH